MEKLFNFLQNYPDLIQIWNFSRYSHILVSKKLMLILCMQLIKEKVKVLKVFKFE